MELKRMHTVGMGVLAVIGGIGAFAALHRTEDALPQGVGLVDAAEQREAQPRREDRSEQALASKVEALTAEVEALRALVAQSRAAAERGEAPRAQPVPSEAEQHEIWEEYVSYAEAGFNEEPVDSRWASSTGSAIQEEIASSPALRGAARALECRSKSCRVELRDDGSAAFANELPTLVHKLGPKLSSVVVDLVQDGRGQRTQVLYMTRADPKAERAL